MEETVETLQARMTKLEQKIAEKDAIKPDLVAKAAKQLKVVAAIKKFTKAQVTAIKK